MEKEMQKDSYVDERGDCALAARPALRQQLAQARAAEMPEESIRILECKVLKEEAEMRQAQPMGRRMD